MKLPPDAMWALRSRGVRIEEFEKGLRAADPYIVSVLLAKRFDIRSFPANQKKIPCFEGWIEKATADTLQLLKWQGQWRTNFSILTGIENGIWVIDVDGPEGEKWLALFINRYGLLPPTWTTTTGRTSGGRQFWFRANPFLQDLRNGSDVLGSDGIDVRGWHGHAVIPGSLHKSGVRYGWAPGCAPDEVELAELPKPWFDALLKHEEPRLKTATPRSRVSRKPPLSGRIANEKSTVIGDGIGGGYHPIYCTAVNLIRQAGVDVEAGTVAAILRAKVMNAPVRPDRDPADIERYSSEAYLLDQIESARRWVAREQES